MKKILLLDSNLISWRRRPRTKNRRIRLKWKRDKKNWGPSLGFYACHLLCGSAVNLPPPKRDKDGNLEPCAYKLHPETWKQLLKKLPHLEEIFEVHDE